MTRLHHVVIPIALSRSFRPKGLDLRAAVEEPNGGHAGLGSRVNHAATRVRETLPRHTGDVEAGSAPVLACARKRHHDQSGKMALPPTSSRKAIGRLGCWSIFSLPAVAA